MSFDGALGDVQITSDLGVVASLEQQVNDLPFAGSHRAGQFFHGLHLAKAAPEAESDTNLASGHN